MPQLDPLVFVPQLVWLAISFVILYLLLARLALPRIGDAIEARQDRIAHDLDTAATLKSEAEAVLRAYERTMAEARSEAQSEIARAAEQRAQESAARQAEPPSSAPRSRRRVRPSSTAASPRSSPRPSKASPPRAARRLPASTRWPPRSRAPRPSG